MSKKRYAWCFFLFFFLSFLHSIRLVSFMFCSPLHMCRRNFSYLCVIFLFIFHENFLITQIFSSWNSQSCSLEPHLYSNAFFILEEIDKHSLSFISCVILHSNSTLFFMSNKFFSFLLEFLVVSIFFVPMCLCGYFNTCICFISTSKIRSPHIWLLLLQGNHVSYLLAGAVPFLGASFLSRRSYLFTQFPTLCT